MRRSPEPARILSSMKVAANAAKLSPCLLVNHLGIQTSDSADFPAAAVPSERFRSECAACQASEDLAVRREVATGAMIVSRTVLRGRCPAFGNRILHARAGDSIDCFRKELHKGYGSVVVGGLF